MKKSVWLKPIKYSFDWFWSKLLLIGVSMDCGAGTHVSSYHRTVLWMVSFEIKVWIAHFLVHQSVDPSDYICSLFPYFGNPDWNRNSNSSFELKLSLIYYNPLVYLKFNPLPRYNHFSRNSRFNRLVKLLLSKQFWSRGWSRDQIYQIEHVG